MTVLAEPLVVEKVPEPTEMDVDKLHAQYIAAISELFETHKHRLGYGDQTLHIL